MDYNEIAKVLKSDDVIYTEITRYKASKTGAIVRETICIDYFNDGDYQWTSSVKPIHVK